MLSIRGYSHLSEKVKDVREAFVRRTGEDSPEFSGRAVYSYSVLYGEEIGIGAFLLAFDQRTTTCRPPSACWSTMSPEVHCVANLVRRGATRGRWGRGLAVVPITALFRVV